MEIQAHTCPCLHGQLRLRRLRGGIARPGEAETRPDQPGTGGSLIEHGDNPAFSPGHACRPEIQQPTAGRGADARRSPNGPRGRRKTTTSSVWHRLRSSANAAAPTSAVGPVHPPNVALLGAPKRSCRSGSPSTGAGCCLAAGSSAAPPSALHHLTHPRGRTGASWRRMQRHFEGRSALHRGDPRRSARRTRTPDPAPGPGVEGNQADLSGWPLYATLEEGCPIST